jgi:hypothetical protein
MADLFLLSQAQMRGLNGISRSRMGSRGSTIGGSSAASSLREAQIEGRLDK